MILYNVTININQQVEKKWKDWMIQHHIPDVMATRCFVENKMFKLLNEVENGGSTYAIQYFASSMKNIENYQSKHAPRLQEEHSNKFKDQFVAFRTLLELVDEN